MGCHHHRKDNEWTGHDVGRDRNNQGVVFLEEPEYYSLLVLVSSELKKNMLIISIKAYIDLNLSVAYLFRKYMGGKSISLVSSRFKGKRSLGGWIAQLRCGNIGYKAYGTTGTIKYVNSNNSDQRTNNIWCPKCPQLLEKTKHIKCNAPDNTDKPDPDTDRVWHLTERRAESTVECCAGCCRSRNKARTDSPKWLLLTISKSHLVAESNTSSRRMGIRKKYAWTAGPGNHLFSPYIIEYTGWSNEILVDIDIRKRCSPVTSVWKSQLRTSMGENPTWWSWQLNIKHEFRPLYKLTLTWKMISTPQSGKRY